MSNEPIDPATKPESVSRHKKGLDFEKDVRDYLVNVLEFEEPDHRSLSKGKSLDRSIEIDLYGVKVSHAWRALSRLLVVIMLFLAFVGMTVEFVEGRKINDIKDSVDAYLRAVWPSLEATGFLLVIFTITAILYVFLIAAILKDKTRVWIECRNHKAKIDLNYIGGVAIRRQQAAKYRPTDEIWVVSRSGFSSNALGAARDAKVHCVHFPAGGTPKIVNDLPSRVLQNK